MRNLGELIELVEDVVVEKFSDVEISEITFDSRAVAPGTLFVCIPGAKVDGHDFAKAAVASGASAVVASRKLELSVPTLYVPDTRAAMRQLAPVIYDYPARSMRLIGLTGTNGKTTTTYLLKAIFEKAGNKCGVIGTIQSLVGDTAIPVKNTTPDAAELQRLLALMLQHGVRYVFMEVSSHALELGRVDGCEFDIALFTNLTQDHLDFHGTLENYRAAKAKLFAGLGVNAAKPGKCAIINADDPASKYMKTNDGVRRISYGIRDNADIRARNVDLRLNGCSFELDILGKLHQMTLNITGLFNVYNTLAAIAVAVSEGIEIQTIVDALNDFKAVCGRFELVNGQQPFAVAVDYAHTPDGLENILQTAREVAKNKIIIVFGCGGDRDRTKRPIMGEIAAQYADTIIVTSDNPRSEDPEKILDDIQPGIEKQLKQKSGAEFLRIADRAQAIEKAIEKARPGDVVLIAGKGHETYQILAGRTIDFDDRKIAEEILSERYGVL